MTWLELADGVYARRHAELDLTLGLVVGAASCLVVDTGTDEVHGAEFAAAVRERTDRPWQVVLTHAHFDHVYGTAAFLPCPVWAHARWSADEAHRREWVDRYRAAGRPGLAARLATARLVPPDHTVTDRARLDLGGRAVALVHPGLGHTDHDLVVHVPDAGVLFAGDLVEQGAPPSVGPDSRPDHWPSTVDNMLALGAHTVVPGHGDPVDQAFVRAQRDSFR